LLLPDEHLIEIFEKAGLREYTPAGLFWFRHAKIAQIHQIFPILLTW